MMKMSGNVDSANKKANIVEQILEQGQRLRNAMVKSILDNDPFYSDIINSNNAKNQALNDTFKTVEKDYLPKLHVPKSSQVMSADFPDVYCGCHICNIYKREIFFADRCQRVPSCHFLNRLQNKFLCNQFTDSESNTIDHGVSSRTNLQSDHVDDKSQPVNPSEEIVRSIQSSYRSKALSYFKYIDSIKISIHNISLNQAGNRKAISSGIDINYQLPKSISQSYFVEYSIPECLTNALSRSNSKVDSGLMSNVFRICSKKLQNEDINFKHTSIHDINNLQQFDLNSIELKFQVSTRAMKQKRSNVLGYATFNMRSFEITKNMCCLEHLPIMSDDFVLGTLKVTVQLGCGRLYFGKEFVDFIETNRKDSIVTQKSDTIDTTSSQAANSVIFRPKSKEPHKATKVVTNNKSVSQFDSGNTASKEKLTDNEGFSSSVSTLKSNFKPPVASNHSVEDRQRDVNNDNIILYGLIYISEAKYFEEPINSYFTCQPFCLDDTLCSRVVCDSKDPIFNFYQKVPFIYDASFLNYLRDNSIVIDFWEKYEDEDIAIGTSELSLYQFYVTYRNRVIANTLIQNLLPVTIADWWEPISNTVDGKLYGQIKVLVAVGTLTQIQNLEVERGLKNESLSVTYVPIAPESNRQDERKNPINPLVKKPNLPKVKKKISEKPKSASSIQVKGTADKAVQSEENMESQKDLSGEKPADNTQKDLLQAFLTQIMEQQRRNNVVESATNTSPNVVQSDTKTNVTKREKNIRNVNLDNPKKANFDLKKTADLLDYLNGALALDDKTSNTEVAPINSTKQSEECFKAHVVIEGALHLPSRRKCKVKKNRKKNIMYEDTLPSTYVSFETVSGADIKYTGIIQRCTNPQWDYEADVLLPVDMLTNNQKRLIFKVWRKINTESSHPNIENDVIIGFAALDLTVLLVGLPSVHGWFNIVDFSSKCNGQIKIHVTPLENISKFSESTILPPPQLPKKNIKPVKTVVSSTCEAQEPPGELLSRALKRKFTELEEITERLRSRLADVTKEDSDTSNDDFADEFEKDINSLSIEEDYDMLDLKSLSESSNLGLQPFSQVENGANNFLLKKANDNNFSIYSKGILHGESFSKGAFSDSDYSSTRAEYSNFEQNCGIQSREKQLIAGKQHIDSLLEKLTLLAGNSDENAFSSRYVSGCSTNQERANVDNSSNESEPRSAFNLDTILKPELFNQLCSSAISPPSLSDSDMTDKNSTSNSLLTQFVNHRQAPDGAGFNTTSSSNSTCFNIK